MQKWRCNSSTHNCRLSRIYKTMNHNNQNQTNNTWLWKTLKKVHMHSLQSNIPHFLGLNRCAMSRKWICFKFKFNLKWEADILSQSDDGVGTQKWASPEPISQLLNTPTCNIHTRTILIDILTSKRSVGTRVWRVPATRPDPNFFFATRTRPKLFFIISEFRVFHSKLFPSRPLQIF